MPVHSFLPLKGKIVETWVDSDAIKDNLLGDPGRRLVQVYLPPEATNYQNRFPLLVYLASFTNSSLKMTAWKAFGESLPQRLERLVHTNKMGPVVVAFPDCFTSLGGNQYINSEAIGHWEDFLLGELVPKLINEFPIENSPKQRAVLGLSSGGYGALIQGLLHGNQWGAIACHSGDIGFDLLLRPLFPKVARMLQKDKFNYKKLLDRFRSDIKLDAQQLETVSLLAMSASYDPDPSQYFGIRLPFDTFTCELIKERWSCWLDHDPLELINLPHCQNNLSKLLGFYLDCGNQDQYNLQFGARSFVHKLRKYKISHHYEEFEDNHSDIDYRLDASLPFLYSALASD